MAEKVFVKENKTIICYYNQLLCLLGIISRGLFYMAAFFFPFCLNKFYNLLGRSRTPVTTKIIARTILRAVGEGLAPPVFVCTNDIVFSRTVGDACPYNNICANTTTSGRDVGCHSTKKQYRFYKHYPVSILGKVAIKPFPEGRVARSVHAE